MIDAADDDDDGVAADDGNRVLLSVCWIPTTAHKLVQFLIGFRADGHAGERATGRQRSVRGEKFRKSMTYSSFRAHVYTPLRRVNHAVPQYDSVMTA